MSIKKNVILCSLCSVFLFLASIAFTGSIGWAQITDGPFTFQCPGGFTRLSSIAGSGNTRINIEGPDLNPYLIYAIPILGDGTAESAEPLPINDLQVEEGVSKSFYVNIPKNRIADSVNYNSAVVKVQIMVVAGGTDVGTVEFEVDHGLPLVMDLFFPASDPTSINPTNVYNFFNCFVDANEPSWVGQQREDAVALYLKEDGGLLDPNFIEPATASLDPAGFTVPGRLMLDFGSYLDANMIQPATIYDCALYVKDKAANQLDLNGDSSPGDGPLNVIIQANKYIDSNDNASTSFVDPDGYQIVFPNQALATLVLDTDVTNYIVDGKPLTGVSTIILGTLPGDPDILEISGSDATNLGLTANNWTGKSDITVAHIEISTGPYFDYAFGVDDGTGPRLVSATVDQSNNETILRFSEDLMPGVDLQLPFDILYQIAIGPFTDATTLTYTDDPKELSLNAVLIDGDPIFVLPANNTIQDMEGNPAQENVVGAVIARTVSKIAVTSRNTIEITFNDAMDDAVSGDDVDSPSSYFVDFVPGLTETTSGRAQVNTVDLNPAKTIATLILNGQMTYTNRLPGVSIEAGDDTFKGSTGGRVINKNDLPPVTDEVGPYIMSARFDTNGYNTGNPHGMATPDRTFGWLSVTFSEQVDLATFNYSPESAFSLMNGSNDPDDRVYLGIGAEVMGYIQNDANSIDIQMGNLVSLGNNVELGTTTINFKSALVKDIFANSADTDRNFDGVINVADNYILDDVTKPWVTSVVTVNNSTVAVGAAGRGKIDRVEVTLNENVSAYKKDGAAGGVLTRATVGGEEVTNVPMPIVTINTLTLDFGNDHNMDTGSQPEVVLYFDANDYIADAISNTVANTITIPGNRVVDEAAPLITQVSYQDLGSPAAPFLYRMTVTFSEELDPNTWMWNSGEAKNVDTVLAIYDAPTEDWNFSSTVFDLGHTGTSATRNLIFTLGIENVTTDGTYKLDNAAFTAYEKPRVGILAGMVLDTADTAIYAAATTDNTDPDTGRAELYVYTNAWDTAADYKVRPLATSRNYMDVYGTVYDPNGRVLTNSTAKVAAYHYDDMVLYEHTVMADGTLYVGADTARWDNSCEANHPLDQISRIFAPANNYGIAAASGQNSLCLGSTRVQADGSFYLTVYGLDEMSTETAFSNGNTVYLVLDDNAGNTYLVSGKCEDEFNLKWHNSAGTNPETGEAYGLQPEGGYDIRLDKQERITLNQGWNLISTSVKTLYSDGTSSPQLLLDNAGAEIIAPVVSINKIEDVFCSLKGEWSRLFMNDPDNPGGDSEVTDYYGDAFNQTPYFTAGHGCWIYIPYVTNTTTLTVFGDVISAAENNDAQYRLPLTDGFNLVGHWGGYAKHAVMINPAVTFSSSWTQNVLCASFDQIFNLDDTLSQVKAFNGVALSWYSTPLPAGVNYSLTYAGPGFGYWINVGEGEVLRWDVQ